MSRAETAEFAAHWRPLLAAVIGVALGPAAIAITYTLGALTPALIADRHWTRAEVLLVGPAVLGGALIGTQVVGWLLDRAEPRRIVTVAQICFGLCFFAIGGLAETLYQFWALYFLLGITGAGASPLAFVKILSGAFRERRGLAIGLALSGTGISGTFAPTYVTALVAAGGWRLGYFGIGLLVLLIAVPSAWVLLPRGRAATAATTDALDAALTDNGPSLAEAIRSLRFWALAIAFMLAAGAVTALLAMLVPLLIDAGHGPAGAAALAGIVGIAVIIGRVGTGVLMDRVWAPGIGAVIIGAAAVATALIGVPGLSTAFVGIAIFTIGLATGAEFDLNAYLTARYFGTRHLGKIYGLQYSALIIGSGLAAPLAGWLRDQSSDYQPVLWSIAAAFALCALLLLAMGRYPDFTSPPARHQPE